MKHTLAIMLCLGLACFAKAALPDGSEFTKLRMDYAASPDALYSWNSDPERRALLKIPETDKKQFVEKATAWLKKCPVDAEIHLMTASALSALGRSAETVFHRYMFYGLMQSITGTADGLSPKTAFKVIAIPEEYLVCNYLGAEVKRQRLEGHFDVLTVSKDNATKDLYFDASIVLKKEAAELGIDAKK